MTQTRAVLSADQLTVAPFEYAALLEVRELFANGKLYHDSDVEVLKPDGFNMNTIIAEGSCGTTACIGGWMFLAMERDRTAPCNRHFTYVSEACSSALVPLFFPFTDIDQKDLLDADGQTYDFPFELIPPSYALAAIDNFLATGDPDWPAVIGLA